MPSTLARITEMIDKENASLAQVARVISSDPAIAMKALRLVNSASYGLGQEIVSLDHAVVMLGTRVIRNLVITATVFETMKIGTEAFMRHSVCCGVAMKVLLKHGPLAGHLDSADEAFIMGLFHDVGKLIFAEFMGREQAEVEKLARAEQVPWFEAEKRVIGVDHAELGARLAAQWRLPQVFVQAIAGHHTLDQAAAHALPAAALAVADHLCNASGRVCHELPQFAVPEEAWAMLGVEGEAVLRLCGKYFEALPEVEEYLSFAE